MKLLLSGGGDPEQVIQLDKIFAEHVKNGKILYIPVAMDKIPYQECLNWFESTYEKYGIKNIDMGIDLNEITNLNQYKGIFIGGGNTFKLLNEIKKTNFDIKLKEYLNTGGFVYGGSAGAIIFGSSIDTAIHADANYLNLENLDGLNILNNKKVWCHYDPKKDQNELDKIKGNIIVLYEESGILFDGKNITSIGREHIIKENN